MFVKKLIYTTLEKNTHAEKTCKIVVYMYILPWL